MNFDAISKNVKILQIGPVEPKLWKIREINVVWLEDHAGGKNHFLPLAMREEMVFSSRMVSSKAIFSIKWTFN